MSRLRGIDLNEGIKQIILECTRTMGTQWGNLPLSHYDVTWVATLRDPITKKPIRPRWIQWLIHNQNADGSWGYHTESTRARFLTTFQGCYVLSHLNQSHKTRRTKSETALERARSWLLEHQHDLATDWQDPAGYELILSSQVSLAETDDLLELNFNDPHLKDVKTWRDRKIKSLCDQRALAVMPILHSAESLGDVLPVKALERHILSNGSMANSIATSAWLVNHSSISSTSRRRLVQYLSWCARVHPYPVKTFPFEITELGWTLGYLTLAFSRKQITDLVPKMLTRLHVSCVSSPLLGFSSSFNVPDLDDTLMVHLVLRRLGLITPTKALNAMLSLYQAEDHWRTYVLERGVSMATQVRALWAAPFLNNDTLQDVALKCLLHHRWKELDTWTDKYVPSPWYSLTHLVLALYDHPDELLWPEMLEIILDWLETQQHANGSYGIFMERSPNVQNTRPRDNSNDNDILIQGTVEETALALICAALLKHRWNLEVSDHRIILRALQFITGYLRSTRRQWFSITWMAKAGLYAFKNVLLATVLTALRLVQQEFKQEVINT